MFCNNAIKIQVLPDSSFQRFFRKRRKKVALFSLSFLPLHIEVGREGDAVVLVVDPEDLLYLDDDGDVVGLHGVGKFELVRSFHKSKMK